MSRILIVDDEKSIRITLSEFIIDEGHDVEVAQSALEALEVLENNEFDVIVTDIVMPRLSGVKLLKSIREVSQLVQVILITGEPNLKTASEALRLGAYDYLTKPVSKEDIIKTVNSAAKIKELHDEKKRLQEENRNYQKNLEKLVVERTHALRESEEKFRRLFDNAPLGYQSLDAEGNFIEVNETWCNVLGYTREEVLGKNFGDFIDPGYSDVFKENFPRFKKIGSVLGVEFEMLRKDGSKIVVSFDGKVSHDDQGSFLQTHCVLQDITVRKQAEEALISASQLNKSIIDSSPIGILIYDSNGQCISANESIATMLETEINVLKNQNYHFLDTWKSNGLYQVALDVLQNNIKKQHSFSEINKSGSTRFLESYLVPFTVNDVKHLLLMIEDISDRRQALKALDKSEKSFRSVIETANDAIVTVTSDGLIITSNPATETLFGYAADELAGKDLNVLLPERFRDKHLSGFKRLIDGNESKIIGKTVEVLGKNKDGIEFPLELSLSQWKTEDGLFITGLMRSIEERKAFEEELARERNLLKAIIDNIPVLITRFDPAEQLLFLNREFVNKVGWKSDEYELSTLMEKVYPDPQVRKDVFEYMSRVGREWKEFEMKTRSGEILKTEWSNIEVGDGSRIGIGIDVTERKKAEEALKETSAILQTAMDCSSAGIAIADAPDGKLRYVNEAGLNIRNQTDNELVNEVGINEYVSIWQVMDFNGDPFPEDEIPLTRAIRYGEVSEREMIIRRPNSEDRYVLASAAPILDDNGEIVAGIVVFPDITELKLAEMAIHESESRFRSVIEQSNDAIYIIYNEKFDLINKRFTSLTGVTYEDSQKEDFNFIETIAPQDRELIKERMKKRSRGEMLSDVYEFSILHKDGTQYHVQASVTEIKYKDNLAVLGILRDITEQKMLENQLLQAQKIESIGHLAGGIAHDFNNILTPILGNSSLALMKLDPSHELYDDLMEISETADRARELTRQLLAFSRKQVFELKRVSLNRLVADFRKILRRSIREDIEIICKYSASVPAIKVDVSQIEQVLMNLVVNAQDAIERQGTITISTGSIFLGAENLKQYPDLELGQYVVLQVEDTGSGMNRETQDSIFNPFFTTKAEGKGTGLGLSTAYGIVRQHHGMVKVESEINKGTKFEVYLPAIDDQDLEEEQQVDNGTLPRGNESILIVEDDLIVQKVAGKMLRLYGYNVSLYSDGNEAIEAVKNDNLQVDLLVTDVIMPSLNGRELHDILNKDIPELKVLYMSGYTADIIASHGILEKGINFIAKPLDMKSFVTKVRKVLDAKK